MVTPIVLLVILIYLLVILIVLLVIPIVLLVICIVLQAIPIVLVIIPIVLFVLEITDPMELLSETQIKMSLMHFILHKIRITNWVERLFHCFSQD